MHRYGRISLVALTAFVLCQNLSAEQNDPDLAAEAGMHIGASGSDARSRVLIGARFGLYDVDVKGLRRYRQYGLEVDAVSVGGKREVYGLQGGFASSCSFGGGLFGGVCNFVSDYKGVELGFLNVFNADDRQFLTQSVTGGQVGAINLNSSELALQIGLVNAQEVKRDGFAMEIGLVNFTEFEDNRGAVVQCGFWNWNRTGASLRGDFVFQLGIVNWLEYGREQGPCVQIGFVNMKKQVFEDRWGATPLISISM